MILTLSILKNVVRAMRSDRRKQGRTTLNAAFEDAGVVKHFEKREQWE